jgi:hypothetical protein
MLSSKSPQRNRSGCASAGSRLRNKEREPILQAWPPQHHWSIFVLPGQGHCRDLQCIHSSTWTNNCINLSFGQNTDTFYFKRDTKSYNQIIEVQAQECCRSPHCWLGWRMDSCISWWSASLARRQAISRLFQSFLNCCTQVHEKDFWKLFPGSQITTFLTIGVKIYHIPITALQSQIMIQTDINCSKFA